MHTSERILTLFEAEDNRLRIMRGIRKRILAEDGILDRTPEDDVPQSQEDSNVSPAD